MFVPPGKGIKAQNLGEGVKCERSGCCKGCGEWDSDLSKDGYCRDDSCKHQRHLLALAQGKAVIYYDGLGTTVRVFSK